MKTDIFKLAIHPAAEVFPMLDEEELAELAADIRENGLRHPIVLTIHDGEAVLVDGRNRREACRIAGVEPQTRMLNGEDVNAFIISENINRRHMTKGQRAMAVAKLFPETGKGGRGKRNSELSSGLSGRYVRQARAVLKYVPESVKGVLSGRTFLSEAYKAAQQRKQAEEGADAQFAQLKEAAPDLADLVTEERMSLGEGMAAKVERDQIARAQRQGTIEVLYKVHTIENLFSGPEPRKKVTKILKEFTREYETYARLSADETIAVIRRLRDGLSQWIEDYGDENASQ